MISLIICSRQLDITQSLKDNISETIGVEYELIVIDNSKNQYSIFQAYNEGVRRSQYPYLCFMHEDILYHTKDWGKNVIEHFKNDKVGLIGVVGGHYMPDCPASWWSTECKSGVFIQGYYDKDKDYRNKKYNWENYRKYSEKSLSVAAVDGLWFCIPRTMFRTISFDDLTFSGFHCYDTDICIQVLNAGFDVKVVFNILIEHFSVGNHNQELLRQKELLYRKWSKYLPIVKGIELTKIEIEDRRIFVEGMNTLTIECWNLQNEIKRIQYSKAYRIGKLILRPLKYIQSIIK